MKSPDLLSIAINDIVGSQNNLHASFVPAVTLLAAQQFHRALAEAYRQHDETLKGWVSSQIHEIDRELFWIEHTARLRGLFSILGVSKTTIDLLLDSEFSSKPLNMSLGAS